MSSSSDSSSPLTFPPVRGSAVRQTMSARYIEISSGSESDDSGNSNSDNPPLSPSEASILGIKSVPSTIERPFSQKRTSVSPAKAAAPQKEPKSPSPVPKAAAPPAKEPLFVAPKTSPNLRKAVRLPKDDSGVLDVTPAKGGRRGRKPNMVSKVTPEERPKVPFKPPSKVAGKKVEEDKDEVVVDEGNDVVSEVVESKPMESATKKTKTGDVEEEKKKKEVASKKAKSIDIEEDEDKKEEVSSASKKSKSIDVKDDDSKKEELSSKKSKSIEIEDEDKKEDVSSKKSKSIDIEEDDEKKEDVSSKKAKSIDIKDDDDKKEELSSASKKSKSIEIEDENKKEEVSSKKSKSVVDVDKEKKKVTPKKSNDVKQKQDEQEGEEEEVSSASSKKPIPVQIEIEPPPLRVLTARKSTRVLKTVPPVPVPPPQPLAVLEAKSRNPPWFDAVFDEDLVKLKAMLQKSTSWLNETFVLPLRPNTMFTPLGWSIERNSFAVVSLFLDHGGVALLERNFTVEGLSVKPLDHAREKSPLALQAIENFLRKQQPPSIEDAALLSPLSSSVLEPSHKKFKIHDDSAKLVDVVDDFAEEVGDVDVVSLKEMCTSHLGGVVTVRHIRLLYNEDFAELLSNVRSPLLKTLLRRLRSSSSSPSPTTK